MTFTLTYTLHIIAAIIWVGGMFFAHMALRPAAAEVLDPAPRLTLMSMVFKRFFFWVWIAIATILLSGYIMVFDVFGGLQGFRIFHIGAMHALAIIMISIYSYIYFVPYQQLKSAVANKEFPIGGKAMNKIRALVTLNLVLGLLTSMVASGGKYINL